MSEDETYDPGSDLPEVTENLGEDYSNWKFHEARKKTAQAKFFELATESFDELAEQLVTIAVLPDAEPEKASARAEAHHPGWTAVAVRLAGEQFDSGVDMYEVILEEDPSVKAFTYINPEDGMVYKRSVRKGSVWLDEVYLKEMAPALFESVVFTTPWGSEIVPPLDSLDAKTLASLQQFIFMGKPTVSLTAPRPAKPEEMA